MAVQMNKIKCSHEKCKFYNGCMICTPALKGGTFSPILKLRLENLFWRLKCFSYTEKGEENDRIFPV